MIQENKKYTGKEVKEMFSEASAQAMSNLSTKAVEANTSGNPMFKMMFDMQNMLMIVEIQNKLFGGDK